MEKQLVITPVKNAPESTLHCALAIKNSNIPIRHIIFDDFSTEETKKLLRENQSSIGYELIHLDDITTNPSPNYKLVLQMAQKEALETSKSFIVVESDVYVKNDTFKNMMEQLQQNKDSGLIGAITVDEKGIVNFPYEKFKGVEGETISTSRSLSFCCTLFSPKLLRKFDFQNLDETKDWFDTFISKKSISLGFQNFIMLDNPVIHSPHGSRPWKQLKYSNPIKYYFEKFIFRRDKI